MALWILAPDTIGNCCTCADLATVCSDCTENPCSCVLNIPLPPTEYTTYAEAEAGILQVADCVLFEIFNEIADYSVYTVTYPANGISVHCITPVGGNGSFTAFSFYASVGTITMSFDIDNLGSGVNPLTEAGYILLDCTGTTIISSDSDTSFTTSLSGSISIPITTAGVYIMYPSCYSTSADPLQTVDVEYSFVSDNTFIMNPVIALWDDSGTSRELDACPKMNLPIQFSPYGSAGTFYADEATAQDALDTQTSNCVGYLPFGAIDSFTATDGGSSLTLVGAGSSNPTGGQISFVMIGCLTLLGGSTLSAAYTIASGGTPTPGTISSQLILYTEDGTLIDAQTALWPTSGGTLNISIPFSGKFYAICLAGGETGFGSFTLSASFSLTSSSTLTVNPAVALYDNGTDCPSRLECAP